MGTTALSSFDDDSHIPFLPVLRRLLDIRYGTSCSISLVFLRTGTSAPIPFTASNPILFDLFLAGQSVKCSQYPPDQTRLFRL